MERIPMPQEIYRNAKESLYQIVTIAEHSETGEKLVIYQELSGSFKIYADTLSMFMEKNDIRKDSGATQECHVERVDDITVDPVVLEFLDAGSYEERLNILAGIHHRITDDMINVMAIATDIEVKPGDVEKRYIELRNCLMKLQKFECTRLR